MFEHTLLLSGKGEYQTTASLIEAVRERAAVAASPVRRSRNRRLDSMQKASARRARVRKHTFRRHRTAS
jgi:hypothetical protein